MNKNGNIPKFPSLPIPDKIEESTFINLEEDDLKTELDFQQCIMRMYDHPETDFYLFLEAGKSSNNKLLGALKRHGALTPASEFYYYKHPKFKRDYVKIQRNESMFAWQKEIVEKGPMFCRIKLELSSRKERALEIQERIEIERSSSADVDAAYLTAQLMEVVQLYELSKEETSALREVPHDSIVYAINNFLFHHGPTIGIMGWGDNVHNIREGGVDSIWNCQGPKSLTRLGIQIKSYSDFKEKGFRKTTLAQITESRQLNLSRVILGLCADLTSSSHQHKCRGLISDIERMTDKYVSAISPEKMIGILKWFQGLKSEPLDQLRMAGYAWLTTIYDSLGNLNHNSWGKGTGGAWSHPKKTIVRVRQQILISAIAISPVSGTTQFRFSVQRSGQGFEVRQDWSPDPNWTWNVLQGDIGRNVIVMVSVRRIKDYYQFNDCDDYTYAIYDVLPMTQISQKIVLPPT